MIRVYRYGLLAPILNADLVRKQMRLGHAYRNTLIEIERGRRSAIRSLASSDPETARLEREVAAAEARIVDAARAVKAVRSEARCRAGASTSSQRESVKEARSERRLLMKSLVDHRRRAREATRSEQDRVDGLAAELQRSARAHCGVYWGTYLLAEAEVQASKKMPLYDGAGPNDPRFVRWNGDAAVSVQLQGGLAASLAFGTDSQFRIRRAAWKSIKGERTLSVLSMRIESDGRDPVWAEWPMVYERSMPPGAVIKKAEVHCRRDASPSGGVRGEEWYATVTLEIPDAPTSTIREGTVAIDVGWRMIGDEIRVATWVDDGEGLSGRGHLAMPPNLGRIVRGKECAELRLDASTLSALRKPESLRSIRDSAFDAARDALAAWIATARADTLPEWFRLESAHLDAWKSAHRLAGFAQKWRYHHFAGDDAAYAALEAWRYHDDHLWRWETSGREKALRRRRELYRVFSAMLAEKYGTIVLEEFDLRPIARLAPVEAERGDIAAARSSRHLVATSELRKAIHGAAATRASRVVPVPCAYTTRTCAEIACGFVNEWNAAEGVHHACQACGAVWDQDENAAKNLLTRYREQFGGELSPGPAREGENRNETNEVGESRWARAKRISKEKIARIETARNEVRKLLETLGSAESGRNACEEA